MKSQSSYVANGITRWLITFSVMIVAVIEVLDMTIVNVALKNMMGALGATRDQITWVLTAYIVAAGVMMPLTGFLVERLGRKRLLLISIAGFLIASLLCGISQSLLQIVLFRIMQGMFGSFLIPLSQYVLMDTFSEKERGTAMAIWGIGVMVGPIFGPTLGGYIVDALDWRWIFFINLPVCFIAFFVALRVIQETAIVPRKTDWTGLILMMTGIGALQLFLDRGQTEDWFESNIILLLALISVISLTIFVIRGLKRNDNIINLKLFADPTFAKSTVLMILFSMGFFSLIALQPLMTQQVMNYSAKLAGLVTTPRGVTSAIAMLIVSRLISKMDMRWFVFAGFSIIAVTTYFMSQFSLEVNFNIMALTLMIQGFGVGFIFVPLMTLAFSSLPRESQAEASGLFNFSRSLGTAIGISLTSTLVARKSQLSWNTLSGHLSSSNVYLQKWLTVHHLTLQNPLAIIYFAKELLRQSSMIAFLNAFFAIAILFCLCAPIVFWIKKPKQLSTFISH